MYQKIGQKIMGLAKNSAMVVIGFCVILAIYILIKAEGVRFQLILILAAVGYAAYVSTWALYGLGQLIDDVHAIRRKSEQADEYDDDELPRL